MMNAITIPASLKLSIWRHDATARCATKTGNCSAYYTPRREATDEDYEWAMKQFTRRGNRGLAASPVLAGLRRNHC